MGAGNDAGTRPEFNPKAVGPAGLFLEYICHEMRNFETRQ